MGHTKEPSSPLAESRFPTTRWSVVRAAGRPTCTESQQALAALCTRYWYPLYAYSRRRGLDADQAADVTQGFFTHILQQKIVRCADPTRGRFRCYLLGAFKHFMSHEWCKARAGKRGGGRKFVSIDSHEAEARYVFEPAHNLTAERLFDRQWALTILEFAMDELHRQCSKAGKAQQFLRFKRFLAGGSGAEYREAGAELGLGEGAVRVLVHRLRRRYRQLLCDNIRQTVESPDQVEEEIRYLFAAIGS
jgi:DNA-directed RNA polymerase specialized sigma24 family protein